MSVSTHKFIDKKLFLLLFIFSFSIFVLTNDGHRYTFDEDVAYKLTTRMATLEPDPNYVEGQSKVMFEWPVLFPEEKNPRPLCLNYVFCTVANTGHSITQVPFYLINENLNIITNDSVEFTNKDFHDKHYVFWRNSLDPSFVFLELFYGPVFAAMSVGIFYLISREFLFSRKVSFSISLVYAFGTYLWAYSQTSLNSVPSTFFILLGFLFFKKYFKKQKFMNLLISGISFGFAFQVRPDALIFVIPIFIVVIIHTIRIKYKWHVSGFIVPISISYIVDRFIDVIGIDKPAKIIFTGTSQFPTPIYVGLTGLLFSPGIGLFVFIPILITVIFSFYDFFKRNKEDCLLFISFLAIFLIFFSRIENWHGLVGWGPRYLIPLVPFLLLPLAASIEKRKSKLFILLLVGLAGIGILFNFVYIIQDTNWFVWGSFGGSEGLYGLSREETFSNRIHPVVLWTFEFSQLTHSIFLAINDLQVDIYLYHLLGVEIYLILISSVLILFGFIVKKYFKRINFGREEKTYG